MNQTILFQGPQLDQVYGGRAEAAEEAAASGPRSPGPSKRYHHQLRRHHVLPQVLPPEVQRLLQHLEAASG